MTDEDIWSVTRLNLAAQRLLEKGFPRLWLEGELSNFKHYSSGHWYFSLKDDKSEVRAVMFRGDNQNVTFTPQDGQQLRVRADVTLYPQKGSYQLQVRAMQPAGQGALLAQLEKLKKKLHAEGLFDPARKQSLPTLPACLGVITSPSGAAIHDILRVLHRRFPLLPVIVYPASVQGASAAAELCRALQIAIDRNECDVLIIGRGGGSLEDLFAFNDETLTRAVAACPIPIVSAVGHEVDFSLTDLAADVRAATPSAAAEQVVPDHRELQQNVLQWQARLERGMQRHLQDVANQLAQLKKRLPSPQRLLQQQAQRLDEQQQRLERAFSHRHRRSVEQLHHLQQRLAAQRPSRQLQQCEKQLANLVQRLKLSLVQQQSILAHKESQRQQLARRLQMAAPENLLERGYSLTFTAKDGKLVRPGKLPPIGTRLKTQLAGRHFVFSNVVDDRDV